jgi:hypothetical protein
MINGEPMVTGEVLTLIMIIIGRTTGTIAVTTKGKKGTTTGLPDAMEMAQHRCHDIAIRGALSPITSEGSFTPGQGILGASTIYFRIYAYLEVHPSRRVF